MMQEKIMSRCGLSCLSFFLVGIKPFLIPLNQFWKRCKREKPIGGVQMSQIEPNYLVIRAQFQIY